MDRGRRCRSQIDANEEAAEMAGRRRSRSQIHASEDGDGATRPSRRRRRCRASSPEVSVPLPDDGDTLSESLQDDGSRPLAPWESLPLDMLWEILLLLSPERPSLLRASAVSTLWRGVATDPNFMSQSRRKWKPPPLHGFFERRRQKFRFTPVLHPPDGIPAERVSISGWMTSRSFDVSACRHGRVLAIHRLLEHFVVFAPLTGEEHCLAVPSEFRPPSCLYLNASVLCAANGQDHVHGFCHKSPFKVALSSRYPTSNRFITSVYSSETGKWGDLISVNAPFQVALTGVPATLVGNVLYWLLSSENVCAMLEFDLDRQSLAVIEGPPDMIVSGSHRIIKTEEGAVGWVRFSFPSLEISQRKKNWQGAATWLPRKTVDMHDILGIPPRSRRTVWNDKLLGYEEANNVIILYVDKSAYMVDLKSVKSTKLVGSRLMKYCHPFISFYPPDMAI